MQIAERHYGILAIARTFGKGKLGVNRTNVNNLVQPDAEVGRRGLQRHREE